MGFYTIAGNIIANTSCRLQCMKWSSAEKQRQYRSRRDADPARSQASLEKEKLAWQKMKAEGKVKKIAELSERVRRRKRKQWKDTQKRDRHRKADLDAQLTPPNAPSENYLNNPNQLPTISRCGQIIIFYFTIHLTL